MSLPTSVLVPRPFSLDATRSKRYRARTVLGLRALGPPSSMITSTFGTTTRAVSFTPTKLSPL